MTKEPTKAELQKALNKALRANATLQKQLKFAGEKLEATQAVAAALQRQVQELESGDRGGSVDFNREGKPRMPWDMPNPFEGSK